jgi:hypothetical protein
MSATFDLFSHTKELPALAHQALSGPIVAGEIIDMQGFEALQFIIQTSVVTAESTFKLEHGDESDLSDASDVTTDDLIDGGNGLTVPTGTALLAQGVGYRGKKRYVRLVYTSGDVSASGTALLGRPHVVPTER